MAAYVEFRGDDTSYLAWLATHPQGYVLNADATDRRGRRSPGMAPVTSNGQGIVHREQVVELVRVEMRGLRKK